METDPTQLPMTEQTPHAENADVFSHEENMLNASEVLRADIEMMHEGALSLIEEATSHPLESVVAEHGVALGLSEEEVSATLVGGEYVVKDRALREKAKSLGQDFAQRLAQSARIGVAAFAIGSSTPAFGDMNPQLRLDQKLTVENTKAPTTREEVFAQMRSAITAPREHMAVLARKDGLTETEPILSKRGGAVSVSVTGDETELIAGAMEQNTADVEIVHTHPLNKTTLEVGGLTVEDRGAIRRGDIPRVAMSPSSTDLSSMAAQLSHYPPGQLSGKVIDPSGVWEYGIADSGAPFIKGNREAVQEMEKALSDMQLTPDEKNYLKDLHFENIHPQLLVKELDSIKDRGPIAQSIREKIHAANEKAKSIFAEKISAEDAEKFQSLDGWFPWMHPGTPDGDAEIARREKVAAELGFRMKYTPNPVVEEPKTDDPLTLKMSAELQEHPKEQTPEEQK